MSDTHKFRLLQTDPRDALRYAHHAVGYINVDAQCDKLVTDDRRQFITLSVHLG